MPTRPFIICIYSLFKVNWELTGPSASPISIVRDVSLKCAIVVVAYECLSLDITAGRLLGRGLRGEITIFGSWSFC